jgi:hypothetical protein
MNTFDADADRSLRLPFTQGLARSARAAVWPSRTYARQVASLRRRIGQPVYIAEINFDGLSMSAVFHSEPRVLLAIADFPRPDPARGLYPHMLVLDDGRGINLGRIARVSTRRAFDPEKTDVLYDDRSLQQKLLYGARRLSPRRIARIARRQLRALLGPRIGRLLGRDAATP